MELASTAPDYPDVSGLVVDVRGEGGFATVVSLADGTTSMYTSTGGGMIGAGAHAAVAEATRHLLTLVQQNLSLFPTGDNRQLPPEGLVRFHVVHPSTPLR